MNVSHQRYVLKVLSKGFGESGSCPNTTWGVTGSHFTACLLLSASTGKLTQSNYKVSEAWADNRPGEVKK